MRSLRQTIIQSAGAVALVGVAGLVVAAILNTPVIDVHLPDGSVAQVRYMGGTPPAVRFAATPLVVARLPAAADPLEADPSFAALERMSRVMDLEAAAMLRDAGAEPGLAALGPGPIIVDGAAPASGGRGYSMVSTLSGAGVCTHSVEYRSFGDGRPPRVVTRVSGSCAAENAPPAPLSPVLPVTNSDPAAAAAARTI